jgi:hypothetical protein
VPTSHHPLPESLWKQRVELISGRCYFVLEKQDISAKDIRSFVRAMAKWFWKQKAPEVKTDNNPEYSAPYTRPVSKTIFDERFDLSASIANQPVTKLFLETIGGQKQLPDHRFYGYVAALALIEIMTGLMGTRLEELDSFKGFGGSHEEGGPDWTTLELEDETNSMIENMIGKAEEFVFKADEFTGQAGFGQEGRRQPEISWEPMVEQEIQLMMKNNSINAYRNKSGKNIGKIKITGLSDYLHTRIRSYGFKPLLDSEVLKDKRYCPRQFPGNSKTIARRLPNILARLNIQDK